MPRVTASIAQPDRGDSSRTLAVFAAVIAALYFGSEILVPIALAILLSFALAPSVRFLHKIGLGRIAPVGITVVLAFVIIAGLVGVIAMQLKELSSDLPRYETTMVRKIQYVKGMSSGGGLQKLEDAVAKLTQALNRSPQAAAPNADSANAPGPNAATQETAAAEPLPVQVVEPAHGPLETMLGLAAPLLHPLGTAFIVLVFVVFILLQREDLRNRAIRLFGASDLQRTTAAIDDAAKRLSRYLLTQCAVNASSGLIVGLALWLVGVPSPVLLGILFALLRFVPYVGPVIGALLPVLLAAAVDTGWSMVVWTVIILLAIETIIGQVVEPFAYGHNTGLSPIAIVIAATFWTVLWGPIGLLLATPLTVCLVVLGRHVEHLEFLDVLLGDRPPLSPPEVFYQRMLANDPIEASDQAQSCLAEMSVPEYYNDVALPGLLLAQEDAEQDRLDSDRQAQIRDAALEVVEDLGTEEAEGEQPKPRRSFWGRPKPEADDHKAVTRPDDLVPENVPEMYKRPGSILCVGARSPLDDAAAAMLTQVFLSHEMGARSESFTSLSKAAIEHLDVEGVALICLSALDGSSPAFMRFVLRRLRRRAPHAKILIGAWWRRDRLRESDEEIDRVVREPKVSTFVDAVRFCLAQSAGAGPVAEPDRTGPAAAPLVPAAL